MKKNKKLIVIITIFVALILLGGCATGDAPNNNASDNGENNISSVEQTNDMSPEELFQAFCDGKITAEARSYYDDTTWTMDNTSFQFEETTPEEELDASLAVTKVDPVDLDNDGEVEYILENAIYGDMCFDCKDGKVVCFAQGEGTAAMCSFTQYDGAYWIVHSDTTHSGRCTYTLTKFNGNLEVVDSFKFGWEDWEDDGIKTYYLDDDEITEADYKDLYDKVF